MNSDADDVTFMTGKFNKCKSSDKMETYFFALQNFAIFTYLCLLLTSFIIALGSSSSQRRKLYEPDKPEKFRQIVLSQKKALLVFGGILLFIFFIALISAFARPTIRYCSNEEDVASTTQTPQKEEYISTDGSPFPWKNIRLPDTIFPVQYEIHMEPDMDSFEFNGRVEVIFHATTSQNFVVLHSKHLKLSDVAVQETGSSRQIAVTRMLEYLKNEQIYIDLGEDLEPSKNYTLEINFGATLSTSLTGFYQSNYTSESGQERYGLSHSK